MTRTGWRLEQPPEFDSFDWTLIEDRGVLMGGRIAFGDRSFPVVIYDPVRLGQDVVDPEDDQLYYEANLIVVKHLTRATAEEAVERLGSQGAFDWLLG